MMDSLKRVNYVNQFLFVEKYVSGRVVLRFRMIN